MNWKLLSLLIVLLFTVQVGIAKRHQVRDFAKSDSVQTKGIHRLVALRQGQVIHKYQAIVDTFKLHKKHFEQQVQCVILSEDTLPYALKTTLKADSNLNTRDRKKSYESGFISSQSKTKFQIKVDSLAKKPSAQLPIDSNQKALNLAKKYAVRAFVTAILQVVSWAMLFDKTPNSAQHAIVSIGFIGVIINSFLPIMYALFYFKYKRKIANQKMKKKLFLYDLFAIVAFCVNEVSMLLFTFGFFIILSYLILIF